MVCCSSSSKKLPLYNIRQKIAKCNIEKKFFFQSISMCKNRAKKYYVKTLCDRAFCQRNVTS